MGREGGPWDQAAAEEVQMRLPSLFARSAVGTGRGRGGAGTGCAVWTRMQEPPGVWDTSGE